MAVVKGVDSLLKKMYYLGTIAKKEDLTDISNKMVETAKSTVVVKSGATRDSIGSTVTEEGKRATIKLYAKTNYAVYIEHGTSKMPARPFLAPAFNMHKNKVTRKIRENIRKVTK